MDSHIANNSESSTKDIASNIKEEDIDAELSEQIISIGLKYIPLEKEALDGDAIIEGDVTDYCIEQNYEEESGSDANEDNFSCPIKHFPELDSLSSLGKIVKILKIPKKYSEVFVDNENYTYDQYSKRESGSLLMCRNRKSLCSGYGMFNSKDDSFKIISPHNHPPLLLDIEKLELLQRINKAIECGTTSLDDIYREELAKFPHRTVPSFQNSNERIGERRLSPRIMSKTVEKNFHKSIEKCQESEKEQTNIYYIRKTDMDVIERQRRFSKVYIDSLNYCYLASKRNDDDTFNLRCYESGCRGTGRYDSTECCFLLKCNHSHNADPLTVKRLRFLSHCKLRAEAEVTPLRKIYDEEAEKFPSCDIPSFENISNTLFKRCKLKRLNDDTEGEMSLLKKNKGSHDSSPKGSFEDIAHEDSLQLDNQNGNFWEMNPVCSEVLEKESSCPKSTQSSELMVSSISKDDVNNYDAVCKSYSSVLIDQEEIEEIHIPKLEFLPRIDGKVEKGAASDNDIYQEELAKFPRPTVSSFENQKKGIGKKRFSPRIIAKAVEKNSHKSIEKCQEVEKEQTNINYIRKSGMDVIEGQRRFSKVYIDSLNYCYLASKRNDDGTYNLRCYESGCRGTGRYDPTKCCFLLKCNHSHYADPLMVQRLRFLSHCKLRAEAEVTPLRKIYDEEAEKFPCDIPSFEKISSSLLKRRKLKRLKNDIEGEMSCLKNNASCHSSPEGSFKDILDANSFQLDNQNGSFLNTNSICSEVLKEESSCFPERTLSSDLISPVSKVDLNNCDAVCESHSSVLTDKKEINERHISETVDEKGTKFTEKNLVPRKRSVNISKMTVIEGHRRFSKLFIDDSSYIYRLNRGRPDGGLMLRCYTKGCPVSGTYSQAEELFRQNHEHNHPSLPNTVAKCQFLHNLKTRAEVEEGSLREMYDEEAAKYPNIDIPGFQTLESTLQRRRRSKIPAEPQSLSEAAIEFERTDFCKSYRGNFFKKYMNFDGCEILIFVSPGLMEEKMSQTETFHIDNSFQILPKGLSQLIIIHLVREEHLFPVAYSFFSEKSRASYIEFFRFLKEEISGFNPRFVSFDFNQEVREVLLKVFPEANISGCWFYYSQNIWRQMKVLELSHYFFNDEVVRSIIKFIIVLPLLPSNSIHEGIDFMRGEIVLHCFHMSNLQYPLLELLKYFEDWLKMYGKDKISSYGLQRKLNYEIQTFYCSYIKKIGIDQPYLIRFIEKLMQIDKTTSDEFVQLLNGVSIRASRRRMINESEKLISNNCQKLLKGEITVGDFLLSVSCVVPRHCVLEDIISNDSECDVIPPADSADAAFMKK